MIRVQKVSEDNSNEPKSSQRSIPKVEFQVICEREMIDRRLEISLFILVLSRLLQSISFVSNGNWVSEMDDSL